MARPIWKGTISFGLVTVPVGLHSAFDSKRELSFRLLHRKDSSPIDYRRFCEKEDEEVPWSEIVKVDVCRGRYSVDAYFHGAKQPVSEEVKASCRVDRRST